MASVTCELRQSDSKRKWMFAASAVKASQRPANELLADRGPCFPLLVDNSGLATIVDSDTRRNDARAFGQHFPGQSHVILGPVAVRCIREDGLAEAGTFRKLDVPTDPCGEDPRL